jgi:Domain of unknown function (DUF4340)
MKIKKEPLVLLVLIAALSAYLALRKTDQTHYRLPEVPAVPGKTIMKIEIDNEAGSVILNKKNSDWEISPQGFPADVEKVKSMVDILQNLSLTALVSEAKDYARYDLAKDKKIRVRAWTPKGLKRDLEVGKTAPTYHHTFIKIAGDSRVYHARGNFRDAFDQTVDSLRDKTVLTFDSEKIREVSIFRDQTSLVLNRKEVSEKTKANPGMAADASPKIESIWEDAAGRTANRKELSDLLGTLSHLQCEKYLDGKKKDLQTPILTIFLKGEKDYRLALFAKKEKKASAYPAVSSESGYPFLLPDWRLEKIMKDPKVLLSPPKEEKKPGKTGRNKG